METTRAERQLDDLLPVAEDAAPIWDNGRAERDEIGSIVREVLQAYERQGSINRAGGTNLPSQRHTIEITEALRTILFPGYYDREAIEETALPYVTGERLVWVYKHLSQEIDKCLCFECRECDHCERIPHCATRARWITLDLLHAIPDIRARLLLDVKAAVEGDPAAHSADEVILAYPSIAAITVHRVAHFLYRRGVPFLPRMMSEEIHHRSGIDIHPGATIGESFFTDHGTGVVIGETTEIGDRVKIYQGVTLGALSVTREMQGHKRHPTIEDDVTIYAGATILGGDTVVGRGSVIGGNVWLVSSVPPYSRVYNEERSIAGPIVDQHHQGSQ